MIIRGSVKKIDGHYIGVHGLKGAHIGDAVRIPALELTGIVISIRRDTVTVEVFDSTEGLSIGDTVLSEARKRVIEQAPGMIGSAWDGLMRPMSKLAAANNGRICGGRLIAALDHGKKWRFNPNIEVGMRVSAGDALGTVNESGNIEYKIMVPEGIVGEVTWVTSGDTPIDAPVARVLMPDGEKRLSLLVHSEVGGIRSYSERSHDKNSMLITGIGEIDTFCPINEGGVNIISGMSGSGRSRLTYKIAQSCNADIKVVISIGQRGKEVAELINKLMGDDDFKSRGMIFAATADMPLGMRISAIDCGLACAEIYRDMGYRVAVIIDSLDEYVEAIKKMTAENGEYATAYGIPMSMEHKIGELFSHAGKFKSMSRVKRTGSLSIISTVGDDNEVFRTIKDSADCYIPIEHENGRIIQSSTETCIELSADKIQAKEIIKRAEPVREQIRYAGEGSITERQRFTVNAANLITSAIEYGNADRTIELILTAQSMLNDSPEEAQELLKHIGEFIKGEREYDSVFENKADDTLENDEVSSEPDINKATALKDDIDFNDLDDLDDFDDDDNDSDVDEDALELMQELELFDDSTV